MKKVVLVNQSTGYLMVDIANAYAKQYDKVVLIAGSIKTMERSLDRKVATDKIVAYDRTSAIKRMCTWLYGTLQIFSRLLLKYPHYEVVYVTNPPMSYLLAFFIRRPFSVIVYDIYPEALKNIGIGERNMLFRMWGGWNRRLFKRARKVYSLSKGMGQILERYVEPSKIKIIPNWSASENFHPIEKADNPFIKEHRLENKFIVLYSGNIGYTHNVEYLVDVARQLRHEPNILFLIIGDGKKKETIQEKVKEYGLESFLFLTWQDKDALPYSLAAADVAVVTLNDDTAQVSVPSKTYNLLAVGAPLLCIAPSHSELGNLVATYQNGSCFEKDKTAEMATYISELKSHPEIRLAQRENSMKAAKNFSYKNAYGYVGIER